MRTIQSTAITLAIAGATFAISSFVFKGQNATKKKELEQHTAFAVKNAANLFVTHGHCSLPFSAKVENLLILPNYKNVEGNPLENMQVSFEINPNTFVASVGDPFTESLKTTGLFMDEKKGNMKFNSTSVYTMGLDWYQINGTLSIKGVSREVKFFATGIREANQTLPTSLILQGQFNLLDWGIDYDEIVHAERTDIKTQWVFLNLRADLEGC